MLFKTWFSQLIPAIIFASFGLSSCHSIVNWNYEQKVKAHAAGKDVCGRRYLEPFIGTYYDSINARELLPERYSMRVADKRDVQPPGTDYVFTADRRITRIDIYVDENGLLDRLKCS